MKTKSTFFAISAVLFTFCNLFSQQSILVLNSTTDIVYKLNANDGTIINSSFIVLPTGTGTPKGVTQVNDKIWIADQTNDDILIYNLDGTASSTLFGDVVGLDNIRGLDVVNNEVWVTNAGSANGAVANSIRRFTTAGVPIGNYPTVVSPFDVLHTGTNAYVSSFTNNANIQILGYDGTVVGNVFPTPVLSNIEQINLNSAGNLIVAVFSNTTSTGNNRGLYEVSRITGAILNYWPSLGTTGNNGIIQLNNGNYLYSSGSGLYLLNASTGVSTTIETGGFQYFTKIDENAMAVSEASYKSFKIYPNPVSETLFVESKTKMQQLEIFSTEGKLIKTIQDNTDRFNINVSSLPVGLYYIKIMSDKSAETFRFIKK
ncbi:T9SS type A sorting domain-containing protein [Chryseobacterium sp.]|uniref:T9SS type A sorting domain-containing protein n=1 Tax=Chryseobacterium sp. TaxID=1871047 RepID=UPI0011C87C1D|nr:T9SS type A sorting domain-containing protein [Chryseobacterium sp.]TXF77489.1 T9SS type A sorting domain-containing protein [Chryseobacterium sp.]